MRWKAGRGVTCWERLNYAHRKGGQQLSYWPSDSKGVPVASGPLLFISYKCHISGLEEPLGGSRTSCSGMGVAELLAPLDAENWGFKLKPPSWPDF